MTNAETMTRVSMRPLISNVLEEHLEFWCEFSGVPSAAYDGARTSSEQEGAEVRFSPVMTAAVPLLEQLEIFVCFLTRLLESLTGH